MANNGFDSATSMRPTTTVPVVVARRGHTPMAQQIITPQAAAGFTCLVGPPGSGVTSVSTELSGHHPPTAPTNSRAACFCSESGLAATPILRMTPVQVGASISSVAVLSRSPATVAQLRLLKATTRTIGLPLSVIELDAPDLVLAGEVFARRPHLGRDCQACGQREPDSLCRHRSDHCGQDWRADEIHGFLDALHDYRMRQPGLRLAAAEIGVPWVRMTSSNDNSTRTSAVRDVLAALVTGRPIPKPTRPPPTAPQPARAARPPARARPPPWPTPNRYPRTTRDQQGSARPATSTRARACADKPSKRELRLSLMMRDELLDHLFDLPTDADITVRIGDACLDITGLAPWGDQGFVSLQCYAADIRDVLKEWGVPASKREQLAAAQPTGPAQ